jgi:hypothetical protein
LLKQIIKMHPNLRYLVSEHQTIFADPYKDNERLFDVLRDISENHNVVRQTKCGVDFFKEEVDFVYF